MLKNLRAKEKLEENGVEDIKTEDDIEVEYVEEKLDESDPVFAQFKDVFKQFRIATGDVKEEKEDDKDKIQRLDHIPVKARGNKFIDCDSSM